MVLGGKTHMTQSRWTRSQTWSISVRVRSDQQGRDSPVPWGDGRAKSIKAVIEKRPNNMTGI